MKRRWIIGLLSVVILFAAFGLWSLHDPYRLHAKERREWKDRALTGIAQRVADATWLTNEVGTLKRRSSEGASNIEAWVSDHLILAKNGEWIVYSATCWKEPPGVHDIFVGRGSNGRWYFSTFHFCVGMCSLEVLAAEQPTNLVSFADRYSLHEFDGRSDICLNLTWPVRRK